jgi:hypothetical protein
MPNLEPDTLLPGIIKRRCLPAMPICSLTCFEHIRCTFGVNFFPRIVERLMKNQLFICVHQVHMRLHTGALPYRCNLCSKRFRTPAARKTHLQQHLRVGVSHRNHLLNVWPPRPGLVFFCLVVGLILVFSTFSKNTFYFSVKAVRVLILPYEHGGGGGGRVWGGLNFLKKKTEGGG